MKWINGILFIIYAGGFAAGFMKSPPSDWEKPVHFLRSHMVLIIILFFVNIVSFGMYYRQEEARIYVEKGNYGEEAEEIPIDLTSGEEKKQIVLEVSPRRLKEAERDKKMQDAFAYLDEEIQGKNASLQEVRDDLDLSLDYEEYPFEMEVIPEDYVLINTDGTVKNDDRELTLQGYSKEEIEKGISTGIKIVLWYEEYKKEKQYNIRIFPKEKTSKDKLFEKVEQGLQKREKEAEYEKGFYIPVSEQGIQIAKSGDTEITSLHVLLAGFLLVVLLLVREQEEKRKQEMRRREYLQRSYPWFVNELVLLLGAGMQIRNIFSVLIQEYEGKSGGEDYRQPLIEELRITVRSMELGVSEGQAYFQLGRRLKLSCYIKLLTLLEQNVKRGSKGITELFEQEEAAALEERKNLAKRMGEEAGTKLLGPMILLLLVVMLMIMIPAFLNFI